MRLLALVAALLLGTCAALVDTTEAFACFAPESPRIGLYARRMLSSAAP